MQDPHLSRRQFLGVTGTLALWLAASPSDLLSAATPDSAPYRVLTPEQAAAFDAFAAQVIPGEPGSPGAREANVTRFADGALATFAREQRAAFAKALTKLEFHAAKAGGKWMHFAGLPAPQQVAAMRAMEREHPGDFDALRTPVLAGMFADPRYGGNAGKVGWKLIGFDDRFSWQEPFGFYDTAAEVKRRG